MRTYYGRTRAIPRFLGELMSRKKRLPSQLAFDIGVSHATVGRWLKGQDIPSTRSCQRLAEYSGIPLERILALAGHIPTTGKDSMVEWPDYPEGTLPRSGTTPTNQPG